MLAVFTFIVGGIFSNLTQSQISYQFEQEVAEVQQSARNAMDIMEREIKLAGFPKASYYDSTQNWTSANSNKVAAGLVTINATNLVFEADVEEDGIVDRWIHISYNGMLSGARRTSKLVVERRLQSSRHLPTTSRHSHSLTATALEPQPPTR